jgi:hypothetical protein
MLAIFRAATFRIPHSLQVSCLLDSSIFPSHVCLGKLCSNQDPDFEGYRYPCKVAYCTRHVTVALKRTVASYYGTFSLFSMIMELELQLNSATCRCT